MEALVYIKDGGSWTRWEGDANYMGGFFPHVQEAVEFASIWWAKRPANEIEHIEVRAVGKRVWRDGNPVATENQSLDISLD